MVIEFETGLPSCHILPRDNSVVCSDSRTAMTDDSFGASLSPFKKVSEWGCGTPERPISTSSNLE